VTNNESGRPARNRGFPPWLVPALTLIAVLGVVLATYWPALSARAQYMDDKFYVGTHLTQHPSWGSVTTFFREVFAPSMVNGYYQPLTFVSVMLDFLDPAAATSLLPFHRTTLLLHLLNVALVMVLLRSLFRNWITAGLLALLYGLHPLNADAVVWIAERKTVLSAFFALSSLLLYVAYAKRAEQLGRNDWKRYGASLFLYGCALLSKPTALPLVAVLFVLDYWPLGRLGRRTLLEKVPFVVLALLSAVVTVVSQVHSGEAGMVHFIKLYYVPLTIAYGVGFYLLKVIWPTALVSDYLYPQPLGLTNVEVLGSAIITVGVIAALALSVRRTRAWLAGGLFFFLMLLPTLGLIRYTSSIATNRSMYLPMVGLLLPLQWAFANLWQKSVGALKLSTVRVIAVCVGAVLATSSAYATRNYESHWQDTLTLLRYYLSQQPNDWRLHTRMGNEWIQRGDHRAAIGEFNEAIRLNRGWTENHLNAGRALFTLGDYAEAAQAFSVALEQTPNDWRAHMLMGMTRQRLGQLDGALLEFQTAAHLAPKAAAPHFNIATILGQQGKLDEAVAEYRETLRLEPRSTEARRALDVLGARDGSVR
jgi:tetratricopeptide (TPR) repeat protein